MDHSGQEFTTILVEYKQQVIVYELIECMLSNLEECFDFSIWAIGRRSQSI